jgi:hypothetical protein
VSWTPVTDAHGYILKYKAKGGSFSIPAVLCPSGNAQCSFKITLTGLSPNGNYVVAIAAIDAFGNTGPFVEKSFMPTFVGVGGDSSGAPLPGARPAIAGRTRSSSGTSTGSVDSIVKPTPTQTPQPVAIAPPGKQDAGEVKSAANNAARNWTPWVVLAVLVGIAVLSTSGYYYWFGDAEAAGYGAAGGAAATRAPTRKPAPVTPVKKAAIVPPPVRKPEVKKVEKPAPRKVEKPPRAEKPTPPPAVRPPRRGTPPTPPPPPPRAPRGDDDRRW